MLGTNPEAIGSGLYEVCAGGAGSWISVTYLAQCVPPGRWGNIKKLLGEGGEVIEIYLGFFTSEFMFFCVSVGWCGIE